MILDPVLSIASFSFYRGVPRKSIGATVGYLTYLGLIYAIASTLFVYVKIGPLIWDIANWASGTMPPLALSQGKLSSNLKEPLIIRHPRLQQIAIKIDTARVTAVTPAEMKQENLLGYLTQNTIYLASPNKVEAYDLSKAQLPKPVAIDANFYQTMANVTAKVLYPIAFFFTWIFFLFWKHLAALLYSLMALIINAAVSGGLDYSSLYKITVYAQTPVTVLQMASLFLPPIRFFGAILLLVVGVYVWQGIRQQTAEASV